MIRIVRYIAILSTLALSAALQAAAEPSAPSAPAAPACVMDSLPDSGVFMIVNGVQFTKKDFLVASSLEDKIRRLMSGDKLTGENKKAEEAKLASRKRTVSEMLRRSLIRQYAQKHDIKATQKEYDDYVAKLLKSMRNSKKTIFATAKLFGPEEARLFLRYVDDDALAQPLRNHFDTEKILDITDADIMVVSNRWLRAVERTAASNKVELAQMNAALRDIQSGMDFGEAARRYSERPEQGVGWGDFLLDEMIDNPALLEWAKTAHTGDVSGIIEMDDGWGIVKVLRRGPEDLPPGSMMIPRESWKLARITRKLFETAKQLPRDEIIQGLKDYRNKKLQKRVGDAIMAEAKIEWPHGDELFGDGKIEVK